MLSLLKDMGKGMTQRWQTLHLDGVIKTIVEWLPQSRTLLTQVLTLIHLANTMSHIERSPLHGIGGFCGLQSWLSLTMLNWTVS